MTEQIIKGLFAIGGEIFVQILKALRDQPVDFGEIEKRVSETKQIADKWRRRQ